MMQMNVFVLKQGVLIYTMNYSETKVIAAGKALFKHIRAHCRITFCAPGAPKLIFC